MSLKRSCKPKIKLQGKEYVYLNIHVFQIFVRQSTYSLGKLFYSLPDWKMCLRTHNTAHFTWIINTLVQYKLIVTRKRLDDFEVGIKWRFRTWYKHGTSLHLSALSVRPSTAACTARDCVLHGLLVLHIFAPLNDFNVLFF